MKLGSGFFFLILLLTGGAVFAQPDSLRPAAGVSQQDDSLYVFTYVKNGQTLQATVIDGDTVPWVVLDEILLLDKPTFDSDEARTRYYLLKRKVMRVYPYAVIAGDKLDSLNLRLDTLDGRRERRRYTREYNDFLEERFEPELRKLTHSEGQILCKLIFRETGVTVYELISDYRSGWTAFWWNVSANWYEISLKQPYEPESNDEDRLIEQILLRSFSQGLLEERVPFYPPEK